MFGAYILSSRGHTFIFHILVYEPDNLFSIFVSKYYFTQALIVQFRSGHLLNMRDKFNS